MNVTCFVNGGIRNYSIPEPPYHFHLTIWPVKPHHIYFWGGYGKTYFFVPISAVTHLQFIRFTFFCSSFSSLSTSPNSALPRAIQRMHAFHQWRLRIFRHMNEETIHNHTYHIRCIILLFFQHLSNPKIEEKPLGWNDAYFRKKIILSLCSDLFRSTVTCPKLTDRTIGVLIPLSSLLSGATPPQR